MARGDQIKKLRDKAQPKVNVAAEEEHTKNTLCGIDGPPERYSVLQYTGISKGRVGFTRDIFKSNGTIEKISPQITFSKLVGIVKRNLPWGASQAHVQALSAMTELPRQPKPPTVS